MSEVQTYTPNNNSQEFPVSFTDKAIERLEKWLEKDQGQAVHFGLAPAGCSGYKYVIEIIHEDLNDAVNKEVAPGLTVYVDNKSIPFVKGTMIDYVREGIQSNFTYKNPQEKGACGCGESIQL